MAKSRQVKADRANLGYIAARIDFTVIIRSFEPLAGSNIKMLRALSGCNGSTISRIVILRRDTWVQTRYRSGLRAVLRFLTWLSRSVPVSMVTLGTGNWISGLEAS
jgi:hypothetical protein